MPWQSDLMKMRTFSIHTSIVENYPLCSQSPAVTHCFLNYPQFLQLLRINCNFCKKKFHSLLWKITFNHPQYSDLLSHCNLPHLAESNHPHLSPTLFSNFLHFVAIRSLTAVFHTSPRTITITHTYPRTITVTHTYHPLLQAISCTLLRFTWCDSLSRTFWNKFEKITHFSHTAHSVFHSPFFFPKFVRHSHSHSLSLSVSRFSQVRPL